MTYLKYNYESGRQAEAQVVCLTQNHIIRGKAESESRVDIRRHYFRSQSVELRWFVFINFILYKRLF